MNLADAKMLLAFLAPAKFPFSQVRIPNCKIGPCEEKRKKNWPSLTHFNCTVLYSLLKNCLHNCINPAVVDISVLGVKWQILTLVLLEQYIMVSRKIKTK